MRNEFPKGNFEILQDFFKFLQELYFIQEKSISYKISFGQVVVLVVN